MKLDFSLLTQPTQKFGGRRGQVGQAMSMLISVSPCLSPVDLEKGDNLPKAVAGESIRPPSSPNCPPKFEERNSRIDAVVPRVPLCPPINNRGLQPGEGNRSDRCEHLASYYVHGSTATRPHSDSSSVPERCRPDSYVLAIQDTIESGPPVMPEGVKLLHYLPKRPPVQIETWALVNDVPQFIRATLDQLDAALRGKNWLAGNWTVRDLCERLEQMGVKVEVLDSGEEQGGMNTAGKSADRRGCNTTYELHESTTPSGIPKTRLDEW